MDTFISLDEMYEKVIGDGVKLSAREKIDLLGNYYTEQAITKINLLYQKQKDIYEKHLLKHTHESQEKKGNLCERCQELENKLEENDRQFYDLTSVSKSSESLCTQTSIVPKYVPKWLKNCIIIIISK